MNKLGKVLLASLFAISLAACGKEKAKVTLSQTGVSKNECALQENGKTYRCTVHSDGVNDDTIVLGANVYIDSTKDEINKVTVFVNVESAEYGKALLDGTLRVPDAQTFYKKYVKLEQPLSLKEVDKLKYTTKEDIKAVCDRTAATEGHACGTGKSIYKPADLETGATGTAAAYSNILKAAVEAYRDAK